MSTSTTPASTQPGPNRKLLLSVNETCETLSISRSTLYALIRSGQISTVRIGERGVRIPRHAIETFAKAG